MNYQAAPESPTCGLDRDRLAIYSRLRMVAPGFYMDPLGGEYFYLTGLFACMTTRLRDNPLVNTLEFDRQRATFVSQGKGAHLDAGERAIKNRTQVVAE